MKASMSEKGVYLEYEISEHAAFLEKRKQYEDSGMRVESYNGLDKSKSWIDAAKWLPSPN